MAIVPSRQVTSGYFRNHLYVLLGLNVLATLVALERSRKFSALAAIGRSRRLATWAR